MTIKIYHNPRCSKSRQAIELLESKNLNFEIKLYLQDSLTSEEITTILNMLKLPAINIIRQKEAEFKENNLSPNMSDEQLIKAIIKSPKLLERPIVINGKKAAIGRPVENILDIL